MDLTQFSNVSGVLGVIAQLLIACAFVLLWVRTQSRHVLLYRLWRLLHGSQPIHNPEINAFIEDQNSLMSFRFLTGVQVKTLESARTLIQWAKLNDVEMQDIATCRDYFDSDLRRVRENKLPPRWQQNLKEGLTILALLATVGLAVGISVNDALLQFKATGHWLFLSTEKANVIWPLNAEVLKKSDCSEKSADTVRRTSFSESEASVLCSILMSSEASDYVEKIVKTQRLSFVLGVVFFAFLAWTFFQQAMQCVTAKQLHKRNLSPDIAGGQMSLKLDGN